MRTTLKHLLRSEDGATTVEYGFLIVLCTGAALAALLLLDQSMQSLATTARERMGAVDVAGPVAPAPAPSSADRGRRGRGWGPGYGRGWGTAGSGAGGNPPTP